MKLKKSWIMIAAVALLLTFAVSGTIAWIAASTDPVVNEFTPGKIDTEIEEPGWDGKNKSTIQIKNAAASTISSYVRVSVSGYWMKDGVIVRPWTEQATDFVLNATPNAADTDDSIPDGGYWFAGSDGFYYFSKPLAPGEMTTNLISETLTYETTTEGETLVVNVVHQSIQTEPASTVETEWKVVTVDSNGNLTAKTTSTN